MSDTNFTGGTINAAGIADWGLSVNWSDGVPQSGGIDAVVTLSSAAYDLQINSRESFTVGNVTLDTAKNELSILGELAPAGTLYLEAGLFDIASSGVLDGGAIAAEGATVNLSGLLINVTVDGPLTLAPSSGPTIEGNFLLAGPGGIGPGSLALTGGGVALSVATTQALDNATITIGGGGEDEINAVYPTVNGLTFGTGLVIDEVAPRAITGIDAQVTLRNQGVIEAQGSASAMSIEAQTLFNDGTIAVTNTAAINLLGNLVSDPGASGQVIITGNGVFSLNQGGVGATVTSSETIDFGDNTGTLALYFPTQFSGVIENFATGDVIQLPGAYAGVQSDDTLTYLNNNLTLYGNEGNGAVVKLGVFHLAGSQYTQGSFAATSDPKFQTSLDITTTTPCFAAGTRIHLTTGEIAVEALRIGDVVLCADGRAAPVRWLGHRRVDCRRHTTPTEIWPVRIAAEAFAANQPSHDLFLSPDHAVFVDGLLIPIKHLINGHSIAQIPVESVEYWHVELDQHDVLLAENLPCESYLDTGNRAAFANGAAHIDLHPDFAARSWTDACAELVQDGPRLIRVKQRLFDRDGGSPDRSNLTLLVLADEHPLIGQTTAEGNWCFTVPAGITSLRLVSPTWMPAARVATSLDHRMLGVRLLGVAVDGDPIDLDSQFLVSGFHPLETTAEGPCRWTDGDARLALPLGASTVALRLADKIDVSAWASAAAERRECRRGPDVWPVSRFGIIPFGR